MSKPIIFSAPMILALLDGRKTQTRRIVKPKPWFSDTPHKFGTSQIINAPHEGDLLWVRETWADTLSDPNEAIYRADGERHHSILSWRSPIHMPRWASRLTLEVTGVKVERVQDISHQDATAEGVDASGPVARIVFNQLWESIHGPGAWDANPWVYSLTFKVQKCNIEALGI